MQAKANTSKEKAHGVAKEVRRRCMKWDIELIPVRLGNRHTMSRHLEMHGRRHSHNGDLQALTALGSMAGEDRGGCVRSR